MVGAQMPAHQHSEEEEALKKNIDCVYFLASPLTCKKGAECEYRHSEIARVNPRDCWYWLNGSCLNPKCAFRHPPLEGMLGPQVLPASSAPTLQASEMIATSQPLIALSGAPSHYNSGKQSVPCIFFQKGFCLKGDRCSFSHGVNNAPPLQGPPPAAVVASTTTTFPEPPSTLKKSPFAGLKRCTTEPKVAVEAHIPPPKPTTKAPLQASSPPSEIAPQSINGRHSSRLDDDTPKYRPTPSPCANGDLPMSRTNRVHQICSPDDYDALNSEDAEQNSHEFSPGFDVLVDDDDEMRGNEYYQDEDCYERTRERNQDGRCLTPVNDYDVGSHSGNHKDYDSFGDADRDNMYHDPRRYDSFDRSRGGQYGRDQRWVSSGVSQRIRYPPREGDYQDRIDGSDLRNRLSKQREVNGLRSVKSHDRDRDDRDQSYRGPISQRVTHHLNASERVVSDRLRGRIKLPGRSTSPLSERDVHRDRVRGNSRGRLSPGRLHGFGHQGGSFQDRIKGRVHENAYDGGRDFRGPLTGETFEQNIDFAAPKRLSELRGRKGNEYIKKPVNEHQERLPLGKRKYSESYQHAENDASFEGPKPLVEILKRKRGIGGNEEAANSGTKGRKESGEETKSTNERTLERDTSGLQTEEGLIIDGEGEYQDHEEAYAEEEEGEYEYEQVEGEEDYKEDEAENVEGEYAEDNDVDDFAKKIGVMFS